MATPQQSTSTPTEGTASVAGATSAQLIDLAVLFSSAVQAFVARQVMVVGDPINQSGLGSVTNTVPGGAEFALMVKIAPGSPDLQLILAELRDLRAEIQQLNLQLGALPATPPPISHLDLSQ